jgi:hypothetical protein
MFEQTLKIRNKKGDEVLVRYAMLVYSDWMTFYEKADTLDNNEINYLLAKYVTSIKLNSDTIELSNVDDIIKHHIASSLIKESGFEDDTNIETTIKKYKNHVLSLSGLYDYFIWSNMDINTYLALLESQVDIRNKVIAYLEISKDIDIKKRFEYCAKNKEHLDLDIPDNKYYKALSKGKVPSNSNETYKSKQAMIEEARRALEEETRKYQNNQQQKKKYFNWQDDAKALNEFNSLDKPGEK